MKSGEYLRNLRETKRMSLRQISQKAGVSHTQIADVEKGRNYGTRPTLELIFNALRMTGSEKNIFYSMQDYEKTPSRIKIELCDLKNKVNFPKDWEDLGITDLSDEKIVQLKKYIDFLKSES